ncbi:MAG: DUF5640 domain-containing protein [Coriobacteriia bacterium]|nr:DUF5640 domain-containing protein [Coriobacteriia bacterium]
MKKVFTLLLALTLGMTVLTGCPSTSSPSNSIVGEWVSADSEDYSYVFKADGTGSYTYLGITVELTYEIVDDNILKMEKSDDIQQEYEFTIENNVLTLYDTLGNEYPYNRK